MTIDSTAIILSEESVDSVETADEADLSHEVESEIQSDESSSTSEWIQPLASSVASAQGKAPITADKALVKADSKGKILAKRKRKLGQQDSADVVAEDSAQSKCVKCENWR